MTFEVGDKVRFADSPKETCDGVVGLIIRPSWWQRALVALGLVKRRGPFTVAVTTPDNFTTKWASPEELQKVEEQPPLQ